MAVKGTGDWGLGIGDWGLIVCPLNLVICSDFAGMHHESFD